MRSSKQQRRYLPCLVLFLLLPVTVSSSALAQEEELSLEALPGLNTQKPPKKAPAKKKAGKEKDSKEAAAPDVELGGAVIALPPSESSELALPEPTTLNPDARIAVIFVRTPLVDEATATQLDSALRAVAFLAPLSQNPTVLRPALDAPESSICHADDDSCFVNMAAKDGADSVAVATISKTKSGMNIRVRRLAVRTRKSLGEASAESPNDPVALKAQTEALLCEQLVPDGCANEIQIDTSGAEILYEGRVLPRGKYVPMRVVLPVGLAPLSARLKGKTGAERLVPVLREKMSGVAISVRFERDGTPLMLSPVEAETYRPPPPPGGGAPRRALAPPGRIRGRGRGRRAPAHGDPRGGALQVALERCARRVQQQRRRVPARRPRRSEVGQLGGAHGEHPVPRERDCRRRRTHCGARVLKAAVGVPTPRAKASFQQPATVDRPTRCRDSGPRRPLGSRCHLPRGHGWIPPRLN
jgi:hypothetical protein